MKKADLKDGVVFAYKTGRDERYGSFYPVMILDARNVYMQNRYSHKLELAPDARPTSGNWNTSAKGYLGVQLAFDRDDPRYEAKVSLVRKEASSEDALKHGLRKLPSGRGTYMLVTHLPYLWGEYLTVMAERDERERINAERERQRGLAREELRVRVLEVKRRFEDRGISMERLYVSATTVPTKIELSVDQAERVLDLIDGLRFHQTDGHLHNGVTHDGWETHDGHARHRHTASGRTEWMVR